MSPEEEKAFARTGRRIALLIAAAGVLAILAPWLVVKLGLAARFELLIYLVAMACFVFAMVNLAAMWRRRK
ncbi:hypothetical protein FHY55_09190 [Oceanicola sp. D3]|uniref:DUF5337 family protein n=1 Tax=Oceanicola sp. D3 TaxID=2587163 RepID=UPI001122172A|nr:DUF5337 family protein [Oceanicola sp. D3]QDC09409.1 hypothetical protein FHY55_09190 [Oceanicola sp. D3]